MHEYGPLRILHAHINTLNTRIYIRDNNCNNYIPFGMPNTGIGIVFSRHPSVISKPVSIVSCVCLVSQTTQSIRELHQVFRFHCCIIIKSILFWMLFTVTSRSYRNYSLVVLRSLIYIYMCVFTFFQNVLLGFRFSYTFCLYYYGTLFCHCIKFHPSKSLVQT